MKRFLLFVFLSFISIIAACAGFGADSVFRAAPYLMVGWYSFLSRSLEEMNYDWSGILTAAICLIGLSVGLHFFLRWIYSQSGRNEEHSPKHRWRARWTAGILAVVVLTFTAGVSAVGLVHQSTWLATSPEPFAFDVNSSRVSSASNIKQLATAVHSHHDLQKHTVAGGTFGKDGNGLHGWQTALLPFIEKEQLFDSIKLDLPWHHPANAVAFKKQVPLFLNSPNSEQLDSSGYALSHYASNVRVIGGGTPMTIQEIMKADGLSNTLLIGEAAGNYKPWGHHANWRDPALGINKTADGFGDPMRAGALFAFADGSVHFISEKVSPSVLKSLSTPNGGEKIKVEDWDRP